MAEQALKPGGGARRQDQKVLPGRQRRLPQGTHGLARRRDRAAPPRRARRGTAARAPGRRQGPAGLCLHCRGWQHSPSFRDVRRARHARASTTTCSALNASGPARCARPCSTLGTACAASAATRCACDRGLLTGGRLVAFKRERGWRFPPLYSSALSSFNHDYAFEEPGKGDNAAINVFSRKDGTIRHSWGDEMGFETADPAQDPRGAIDASLLWSPSYLTPGGRGTELGTPSLKTPRRPGAARVRRLATGYSRRARHRRERPCRGARAAFGRGARKASRICRTQAAG